MPADPDPFDFIEHRELALANIRRANLGTIATLLRRVAIHDREQHNCPDTGELLDAVANRVQSLHDAFEAASKAGL